MFDKKNIIIIAAFLLFITMLNFYFNWENSESSNNETGISTKLADAIFDLEGRKLRDRFEIEDESGNKTLLKDIFTDEDKKLVLIYNNQSCHACVDKELKYLSSIVDSTDIGEIIVFSTFSLPRKIKAMKISYNFDFPIYNVKSNALNLLPINLKGPVVFQCNSSLKIEKPFFPDVNNPQLSIKYYDMLMREKFDL